jgi:hypothetical protein
MKLPFQPVRPSGVHRDREGPSPARIPAQNASSKAIEQGANRRVCSKRYNRQGGAAEHESSWRPGIASSGSTFAPRL